MKKLTISVVLALLCLNGIGQEPISRTITGQVRSQDGEPLAGANVTINSSKKGTVTNAKGEFKLVITKEKEQLIISFVGYEKQKVNIDKNNFLNIILEPAVNELDKVVVQAYGTTSKRLATGNIGTVSGEELRKHPVMNAIQALQGLVPGALITNSSGAASASVKVEIRGRNTIDPTMVSEPLYIVDGVPMTILNVSGNTIQASVGGSAISMGTIQSGMSSGAAIGQSPFLNINPSDIESIEVLKDADATAIYGSRGSNGVILITTRKGKAGRMKTEVSAYAGINKITRFHQLLTTPQYVEMRLEALKNDGLPVNMQTAPDLLAWDTTRYTDWQKFIYGGIGERTSIQANMSGGDSRTSYRLSTGHDYNKDISTVKGGNYRGSFSMNLQNKSQNERFIINWSALYTITQIDVQNISGNILLPPNAPSVYDSAGNLNYNGWEPLSSHFGFESLKTKYMSNTRFLNSNIELKYEITKGLNISSSFGYNHSLNEQQNVKPISAQNANQNPTGTFQIGRSIFRNLIAEPKLSYSRFIKKGVVNLLIGATMQTNNTDGLQIFGSNYTNDLLLKTINNAPQKSVSHASGQYKYAGIFSRINYNWNNKYIFNFNVRRDGSSRFGPGKQFGNFASLGTAWIFSEETFAKKLKWLNFGKLRASYGTTGSDQIMDYQFLSRWRVGTPYGILGTYNGSAPLTPIALTDSLLHWEVNKKLEASLSLQVLRDRLIIEVSWYRNRCNNQLVQFPTSAFTGFPSVTSNTPANIENTGWEFILSAKFLENKQFKLSNKFTLGLNRNKLIGYPNFSLSPFRGLLRLGQPLNLVRVLRVMKVDPATGEYIFDDINKDGLIKRDPLGENDDLYTFVMNPKFEGSITTDIKFKNFAINFLFYFRKQKGYSIYAFSNLPGSAFNQSSNVLSRWQKNGDISQVGKYTTVLTPNLNNYLNYSDTRITDASFIRFQNLSLSYQLPEKSLKKIKVGACRLFIQAENILIISNYDGLDPEVQSLRAAPRPRLVTGGLSIHF